MATQQQLKDQIDSLAKSIEDRCRSNAYVDNECQGNSMIYSDNIGYLDPQLQYHYDPYAFQTHQYQPYYPEPFNVYPHSSYPVHEPSPYESSDLRDMPLAYLSRNTSSLSYNPLEQLLKEQEDTLRRCTDKLSEIQTRVQVSSNEARNQVITDNWLQEDDRHLHTTSTSFDTDFHSHESNCKIPSTPTPKQSSKSSLPPILNLSTSETDEEFILKELSESWQLETLDRSDEDDEVDEEIEIDSPEMEIYTEDPASEGPEECAPTLRSDLIPIQTDVVDNIPQQVVVDDVPSIFPNESPNDLVEPSIALDQVVDENVATRLETKTDTVPPPCPEYNIIIDQKTIGSKVGSASWFPFKPSLHHIMSYASWSGEDSFDQPILPKEVLEVERFVIPPVEPFPHFEPSPYIGHTLDLTCFKLLGMYQYYPLRLLMDAREPLGLLDK